MNTPINKGTLAALSLIILSLTFAQTSAEVTKAPTPKLAANYGRLPLSFEANQGQTDPQVKFLSRGNGYTIFLASTEAVMVLRNEDKKSAAKRRPAAKLEVLEKIAQEPEITDPQPPTVVRMKLVGSNPEPKTIGLDQLAGKSNYFIGNDPKKWRTNVPTYGKVKYQNVYPGVDLVYYGNQRQLEYDFIVSPGVNPRVIQLAFEGTDKIETTAEGDLIIQTAAGDLRMRKPIVYQQITGVRKEVAVRYIVNPEATSEDPQSEIGLRTVGFQLAFYDRSEPLIIDPVLAYSTYLSGTNFDRARGISVDSAGNAYITGAAASIDFPTLNAYQATHSGGLFDLFVTKLNASGSALVYSTYIGGSGDDFGNSIAVDSSGDAYVVGTTRSTNFPTANPFQSAYGGNTDGFVIKLNASGSSLLYSTYLGGSSSDPSTGIAVDSSGNAYVTGVTSSANFPTTAGALQTTLNLSQSSDAYVTKLNLTGSVLVYSTYLGGRGNDTGLGIVVDIAGNAYVTGVTQSADFPTVNPLQSNPGGFGDASVTTFRDAFVVKLNPTGSALVYSTYLGGSRSDHANGIAVDSTGNAYVVGTTTSTNFPMKDPLQATLLGSADAFVAKLNPDGSSLVYSTYLGGGDSDDGLAISVDSTGNAYVTGGTTSTNFPMKDLLQATLLGNADAFVAKLNPDGSSLVYSTYLGGGDFDYGYGIAVDSAGNAHVTGETSSTNFPITSGAYQTILRGGQNAFVSKISPGVATPVGNNVVVQPIDEATGTAPVTLTFSNVTQAGATTLDIVNNVLACHPGFRLGDPPQVYDLATTATFTGEITVCINYSGITFVDEATLKLFHVEDGVSVDRTTSLDTTNNVICAVVTSLSPFACCQPDVPPNRPPEAICQDVTVNANASCQAGANINNGSNDPDDGLITLAQTPAGPPATPFGLGKTLTHLTVTDNKGATDSCSAIVTVVDTTPPVLACGPSQTVKTSQNPNQACNASLAVSATASDACDGALTAACSSSTLSLSVPGSTSASCSATDKSGNSATSCGVTLTLTDDTAPSVTCPQPVTAECTGGGGATVTTAATATDNCAGAVPAGGPTTAFYALGTTPISYSASDLSGNGASCSTSVRVVDTKLPTISCPATITVECTGSNGAQVTPGQASASDICGGVTVAGPSAGTYRIGQTPVSYTATDGAGLSASCSAIIQVADTTKPTVSCVESVNPSGKNVPKADNQDGFYRVSASDACSTPAIKIGSYVLANGETIKITQTPGRNGLRLVNTMGQTGIKHFQVGPNDAVITATDGAGNRSQVVCPVPPPEKVGKDPRGRRDDREDDDDRDDERKGDHREKQQQDQKSRRSSR